MELTGLHYAVLGLLHSGDVLSSDEVAARLLLDAEVVEGLVADLEVSGLIQRHEVQ